MSLKTVSDYFWGSKARGVYLIFASSLLLFGFLGAREIWTQEHRWADIAFNMLYHHDYLHPTLDGMAYYDKPLLSYWFIVALSKLTGQLTLWTVRFPSALAGLLAIYSIYRLGVYLKNSTFGLLAGWMLLTSFYFVFWARTGSTDMLNLAGTLFGVAWYAQKRDQIGFFNYTIFFLILAVTALCKGLVGPVSAVLVVLPDLLVQSNWKKHVNVKLLLGMVPALVIYVFPFWASTHYAMQSYSENGLYLVYKENFLRYFQPFDHKGPLYTYFIFLPVYMLPWAFFFIPACISLKSRWKSLDWNSKWMVWATFILFLFFTLSGSRRSYYVLPIVPLAILITADWIIINKKRILWAGYTTFVFFIFLLINFCVLQPLYYSQQGTHKFAELVMTEASSIRPWSEWHVIMLDPESKVRFYLNLSPDNKSYDIDGLREQQTKERLLQTWPMIKNPPANTIFITRLRYALLLKENFKNYKMVLVVSKQWDSWFTKNKGDVPVAFIPYH